MVVKYRSQTCAIISRSGRICDSSRGEFYPSSSFLHNPNTGAITILPCHGNNQIAIGTIYSIIRAFKLEKAYLDSDKDFILITIVKYM